MSDKRYPLSWPAGRPRTPARQRKTAQFRSHGRDVGIPTAVDRLQDELDRIGARDVILSTNMELRLDGRPRADRSPPSDPGAACYFRLHGRETVLACDKCDRVADNIVAIAKHIEALRGQDRWGVGTLEQAFAGYQALPAPEQWWQVLGVSEQASREEINAAYRHLARSCHSDTGGSDAAMARLNVARDAGIAAVGNHGNLQ